MGSVPRRWIWTPRGGAGPWGAATSHTSAAPPPPPPTSTSTLTIAPTTEAVWIVTHGVGHPSTECTWHVHKRTVGGSPHYPHPHLGAVGLNFKLWNGGFCWNEGRCSGRWWWLHQQFISSLRLSIDDFRDSNNAGATGYNC